VDLLKEQPTMYEPIFEMLSDSIVAERIAEAERQRIANALAKGSSREKSPRASRFHHMFRALTRRRATSAVWMPTPESIARGQVGTS
jgi:hypothetical protein